jgi:hypothetical protein
MSAGYREQVYASLSQQPTDVLIEIWQSNNRVEWTDVALEVVREILQERSVELPPQGEPATEAVASSRKKAERPEFNWKLPMLAAIGFGISFGITGAIMFTVDNIAQNAFSEVSGHRVGVEIGALRGIIVGGIGATGLGLAIQDKARAIRYSLAGAIGFGIAFALVISVDSFRLSEIGWAIIGLMGGPAGYSDLETRLASGLGVGIVVGALGGLSLGLASPKYKLISCALLALAGTISFAGAFAFGELIFDGRFYSLWNALGGAIGGAAFGAALALHYRLSDHLQLRRS